MGFALPSDLPREGLIVHTDRGSQYASAVYRKILRNNKPRQSMSGTGIVMTTQWQSHSLRA